MAVTPLSALASKITISRVSNEAIVKELTRFVKTTVAVKMILLGCKNDTLKHVLSFRRQVYMFLTPPNKTQEVSFRVTSGENSYMVYTSTESLRCFECRDIGHKHFTCPHKVYAADQQDSPVTGDHSSEQEDTVKDPNQLKVQSDSNTKVRANVAEINANVVKIMENVPDNNVNGADIRNVAENMVNMAEKNVHGADNEQPGCTDAGKRVNQNNNSSLCTEVDLEAKMNGQCDEMDTVSEGTEESFLVDESVTMMMHVNVVIVIYTQWIRLMPSWMKPRGKVLN